MRIEATVTMKNIYEYTAPAFGYGYETRYIYTMVAEDGTVYVWKTTSFMTVEVPYTGKPGRHCFEDRKGNPIDCSRINKNDVITIKATVKGVSEYKGQPQTEVTRVKVVSRQFAAETYEEMMARKEAEKAARIKAQMDSIKEGDLLWEMPYKQYKEHYSDCETIEGSFNRPRYGAPTIKVIIRAGRLKASGVRGEHYSGYEFFVTVGDEEIRTCYRAISEETAIRRLKKEYPEAVAIRAGQIYQYGAVHRIF